MAHSQQKKKMTHQKRAHLRKVEHLTSVLLDGYRTVSLEALLYSLEPQEKTQRKAHMMAKSSGE
jgi:hypothetical protein